MQAILLGVRKLDFQTNDGQVVKGSQLHIAFDEDGVQGKATDKVFVRENIQIPKIELNKPLNVYFNRKGKVEAITLAN